VQSEPGIHNRTFAVKPLWRWLWIPALARPE
jgi:hypothetical protein